MTELYILLACAGLTNILKYGDIFNKVRCLLFKLSFFKKLFQCSMCLGFWVGVAVGSFLYYLENDLLYVLLPFASSAISQLFDYLLGYLDQLSMFLAKKHYSEDISPK